MTPTLEAHESRLREATETLKDNWAAFQLGCNLNPCTLDFMDCAVREQRIATEHTLRDYAAMKQRVKDAKVPWVRWTRVCTVLVLSALAPLGFYWLDGGNFPVSRGRTLAALVALSLGTATIAAGVMISLFDRFAPRSR